jgi:hypothetical protein
MSFEIKMKEMFEEFLILLIIYPFILPPPNDQGIVSGYSIFCYCFPVDEILT